MNDSVRVDKWLWAARFFKTRSLAREAIKGGKVQIDGNRVKPGRILKQGDRLTIRREEDLFEITVLDLGDRRVSASLAREKFSEDERSMERRIAAAEQRQQEHREHMERPRRPDKRQRRQIIRFTKGN